MQSTNQEVLIVVYRGELYVLADNESKHTFYDMQSGNLIQPLLRGYLHSGANHP